jgi:hypothetical protein
MSPAASCKNYLTAKTTFSAKYSAEYWVDHARLEDVSRNVKDGLKELFDPSAGFKPHLARLKSASGYGTQVFPGSHLDNQGPPDLKGRHHSAELPCIMPLFGTYILW